MNFIAIKDLKRPRWVRERLREEGELFMMNNGRPVALMIDLADDSDPKDMLDAVRDARSRLALSRVRDAARRSGVARMSIDEVNEEIRQVRAERRTGR